MFHGGFKIKAAPRTPGFLMSGLPIRVGDVRNGGGGSKLISERAGSRNASLLYCKWIGLLTDALTFFTRWSVLTSGPRDTAMRLSCISSCCHFFPPPVKIFMHEMVLDIQSVLAFALSLVWLHSHKPAGVEPARFEGYLEGKRIYLSIIYSSWQQFKQIELETKVTWTGS